MHAMALMLPAQINFSLVEQVIETCCASVELNNHLKSTLKKYPGSIHWHYQQPGQSGTLEITLWPGGRRLWFSVQSRRNAWWIEEITPVLQAKIEQALKDVVG
jgi:hypothetical protein